MRGKSSRALLVIVAVFAMSAVTTSAASAVTPEFKPVPTKKKFTATGGTLKASTGGGTLTCERGSTSGEVTGAHTLGNVVITWTGCKGKEGSGVACPIKSKGAKEGEIVTKALAGELGTVGSGSGVGVLLKPASGKTWYVRQGSCILEGSVAGTYAAEVKSVGSKKTTNELVFGVTIGEITMPSGEHVKPELEFFAETMQLTWQDSLTFEEALEVT